MTSATPKLLWPTRRLCAAGGMAVLVGCDGSAKGQSYGEAGRAGAPSAGPPPVIRDLAAFPIGSCINTGQLDDPAVAPLLARQFSQVTPEWQMKMEVILKEDGTFDFGPADRIAGFAREHGQRLYCTTLIWFAQDPVAFKRLDGDPKAFAAGLRRYIQAVVGRYAGQAVGWDVVNETVEDDGSGIRKSMWSRNLGGEIDHMLLAFELAHEADPNAVLFLNDYGLELLPKKRLAYLRLVETLLKRGARLGGLGTQSHLSVDDTQPGACRTTIAELARFGLPIHVSELDVSLGRKAFDLRSPDQKRAVQAARAAELAHAFAELPPQQRFAFTVWGARDGDSWLRRPPNAGDGTDAPLLFDDAGRPKPLYGAVADAPAASLSPPMSFNPIHALADPSNPNSLSKRFRRARMRRVVALIEAIHAEKGSVRIVDLGGRVEYWEMFDRALLERCGVHVTLIGFEAGEGADPLYTQVIGDACRLPEHADMSFDLAHSNSVIEHVGDWGRVEAFARELRRLAPRYYVQTPYYWFPVEPHFSAPFFHWRSEGARARRLMKKGLGFSAQARDMGEAMRDVQDARLLDKTQYRFLFPDAEHIDEKAAGLTKSLIAVRDRAG